MTTNQRVVTIITANLGRGVGMAEFRENLRRIRSSKIPGKTRFYGLQEIDEADTPDEHAELRRQLGDSHRFAGWKTHVPIAVPRTWGIQRPPLVAVASEGVDHLSPRRHVVQAVVFPLKDPTKKVVHVNTHFARDAALLARARSDADLVLRTRLEHHKERERTAWLTADLNSQRYPRLAGGEVKLVTARLDYIRAYPVKTGPSVELLETGSVDLTIDGHNAHWARVRLDWAA